MIRPKFTEHSPWVSVPRGSEGPVPWEEAPLSKNTEWGHYVDVHVPKRFLLVVCAYGIVEQPVREAATICSVPCKLIFDLLTLKVVSESHVTRDTSVPILVFLGLSVLDLGPMYDRQTSDRRQTRIIA